MRRHATRRLYADTPPFSYLLMPLIILIHYARTLLLIFAAAAIIIADADTLRLRRYFAAVSILFDAALLMRCRYFADILMLMSRRRCLLPLPPALLRAHMIAAMMLLMRR